MTSVVFQESVKIQGRTLTHILTLSFQKGLGATAAFVAQHTQKIPFCIELQGSSKFFHRIRHYGLFANANRAENIATARALLNVAPPAVDPQQQPDVAPDTLRVLPWPCAAARA